MIDLPDGTRISNVVIDTALGHDCTGMFPYTLPIWRGHKKHRELIETVIRTNTTVISKSSTPLSHRGRVILFDPTRPWTIVPFLWTARKYIKRPSKRSMANSMFLPNWGVQVHGPKIAEATKTLGVRAIPNIFFFLEGKSLEQLIKEAFWVFDLITSLPLHHKASVLNWSCPNSGEDLLAFIEKTVAIRKALKARFPHFTFIDKMSPLHPLEYLQEMERDGNTIFELFNTIPSSEVFAEKDWPIHGVPGGGGYSGPASKKRVFNILKEAGKILKSPITMGHGVEGTKDIQTLFGFGASSVYYCKLAFLDPPEAIRCLKYNQP